METKIIVFFKFLISLETETINDTEDSGYTFLDILDLTQNEIVNYFRMCQRVKYIKFYMNFLSPEGIKLQKYFYLKVENPVKFTYSQIRLDCDFDSGKMRKIFFDQFASTRSDILSAYTDFVTTVDLSKAKHVELKISFVYHDI